MKKQTVFRCMAERCMVFVLISLLIFGLLPDSVAVYGADQEMSMENLDMDALRSVWDSVQKYAVGDENPSAVSTMGLGNTATVTRGSKIYYPESMGGGWSTFYYYLDGQLAYCLEPPKGSNPTGTVVNINPLKDNEKLAKALYYGYGGPEDCSDAVLGWGDMGIRYLFTHIATSFAYCGWDAFKGCTQDQLEACGVWYYINYIEKLPPVPDAALQFTKSDLNSYLENSIQRTENITLNGDVRNSVHISLPHGITLHNLTQNSETTEETAVIHGGDTFYFSAPLTVTGVYESGSLQGTLDNKWKTIITSDTGDRQTMGGIMVFDEDTAPVSLRIKWLDVTQIDLEKTDRETKNPVEGSVYGIYTDEKCENLLMELKPTDQQGKTSSGMFPYGQSVYYVREISVPPGYLLDTKIYTVDVILGKISELKVGDDIGRAKIKVYKIDGETGKFRSQGDAVLEGAVYGLYAREDIVHPDCKTGVLHPAGSLIEEKTFDKTGWIDFKNLYQGKYYLKEISPPEGYLLDEQEYDLDVSWIDGETPVVSKEITVREQVKKQAFQIIKVSGNGSSTEQAKVQGAQFTVKLKREVDQKGWEKSQTYDILTTDKEGAATSGELPYGTYIVRETKVPEGLEQTKDFIVEVEEDNRTPQFWRVFNDKPFEAYLRMKKVDKTTGKTVFLAGTTFKLRNLDTGEDVVQKVGDKNISEFVTDETGTVTTPLKLKSGKYELREFKAPQGYVINTEKITVTIGGDGAVQLPPDGDQDLILDVEMEDMPQKGKIKIRKHGERLNDLKEEFIYEDSLLEGVKFEVSAAENIYTPDHQLGEDGQRILAEYKGEKLQEGAVLSILKTDKEGRASLGGLPLGRYKIEEVRAPEGFVKPKEPMILDVKSGGQEEAEVVAEYDCLNQRQKVKLSLTKTDEVSGAVLEGAVFGVYAGEDFKNQEDQIILSKDTLIQEKVTDENGRIIFDADLPPGLYYVAEISPPKGYVKDETHYEADLTGDESEEVIEVLLEVKNKPEDKPTVTPSPVPKESATTTKSNAVKTGDSGRKGAVLTAAGSGALCIGFLLMKVLQRKKHFPDR